MQPGTRKGNQTIGTVNYDLIQKKSLNTTDFGLFLSPGIKLILYAFSLADASIFCNPKIYLYSAYKVIVETFDITPKQLLPLVQEEIRRREAAQKKYPENFP